MKKDLLLPMTDKVLLVDDDLLTLSRTRGGMLSMKTEAVDLAGVVDGCIDELVDQAAAGTVATVTLPTTQMSDSALAS